MPALNRFQVALAKTRGPAQKLGWSLLAVILPTALRWSLDRGANGVPFVTYFPVVFLTGLFLGWRWSVLVIALSAVSAQFIFEQGQGRHFGPATLIIIGFFVLSAALLVVSAEVLRRSVLQLKGIAEERHLLNIELNHRVANILTVAQALVAQTFKSEPLETFIPTLTARFRALANSNKIIANNDLQTCDVTELVTAALTPFKLDNNINWRGPNTIIPLASCTPLVLALHELATNAVKYGSLSQDGGNVEISWGNVGEGAGGPVEMRWEETGGPAVQKPIRKGLGSRLLKAQTGIEQVDLVFEPTGVICLITISGA